MKLDIKDRITIGGLMPTEGGLIEQTIAGDILEKTKLKQDEFEKYGVKTQVTGDGRVGITWETNGDISVKLTNAELKLMQDQVNKMDKDKKITLDMVSLCNKILEAKADKEK